MNTENTVNKKVEQAIKYCRENQIQNAVFAVPFQLTAEESLALKSIPECSGMVLLNPDPEITATSSHLWLGCFMADGDWSLPSAGGPLIFIGSQLMLTSKMIRRVSHTGRSSVVCKVNSQYASVRLHRYYLWIAGERLHQTIRGMSQDSLLRRGLYFLAKQQSVKAIWSAVFRRNYHTSDASNSGLTGETLYLELFRRAASAPQKIIPIPGRVVLVNAGLAAGGAERQIVNTLIGLRDKGECESVALLAEYLDHAPQLDFFLHELEAFGIEVAQLRKAVTLADHGLSTLAPPLAEIAADLPCSVLEEVLNLVEEFRSRRPSVVHAWQDSTSIKAGIAAVIAGVPRIVLASRNMTPLNFPYFQDYMYPAYRALASLPQVVYLNNSDAGAKDYTQWLGLPRERFKVVRNGVNLSYLKRVEEREAQHYRESIGIPGNALVLGSVFRFWEEKRPILWLEIASIVARKDPNVHFLLIGEGPMRKEMEAFVRKNGLELRMHLPGARPDVATPLSVMDVFLLTSKHEGTPNVVLEAQWLGLPIVATDAGGTRESFNIGVSGLLAHKPEAKHIASLVHHYLHHAEERALAKAAGPEYVSRMFCLDRMISETLALYYQEEML
ncbi:glycosyltransferase [Methyloversatilis sp. XJ19-13]|uniref:glycosyltransferase n=1 Tax=Methyloversatilis sp. XJ19-13 TaxID=2963430 RepID=UPI00211BF9DD|nr:glycosyltransferase [Methyloversatilis sp. XJ19-13]MCQ9373895.1 glycosyltransferase [Methyloversatilis sp. XJ19-13]